MLRVLVMVSIALLVAGLPLTGQAQWDANQNKWIVGDFDAVFYETTNCTGPHYLLMQGVMEYPLLHNIATPGVKSWNNRIACAELGKNAAVTVCRVQNFKGNCVNLHVGVNSFIGTSLSNDISSIRKTK